MGRRHPSPPQASRVADYGRKEFPNQSPPVPATPTPAPRRELSPGLPRRHQVGQHCQGTAVLGRRERACKPLIRRYQAAADAPPERQVHAVIDRRVECEPGRLGRHGFVLAPPQRHFGQLPRRSSRQRCGRPLRGAPCATGRSRPPTPTGAARATRGTFSPSAAGCRVRIDRGRLKKRCRKPCRW